MREDLLCNTKNSYIKELHILMNYRYEKPIKYIMNTTICGMIMWETFICHLVPLVCVIQTN